MKIKTKEVYYCEYCKKYYLSKYHCTNHELKCMKNPNNLRPCLNGCKHFQSEITEYENEYGKPQKVNCFACNKKNIFMHHPTLLIKINDPWIENKLLEIIDATDQEEMPKECADFEEKE